MRDSTPFTVYLPNHLRPLLVRAASRARRSLSAQLVVWAEDALRRDGALPPEGETFVDQAHLDQTHLGDENEAPRR